MANNAPKRKPTGRRKTARPLFLNQLTEVIMTSTATTGVRKFSRPDNVAMIDEILKSRAEQFKVTLESYKINGQSLHLFVKFKSKRNFQAFMKTIAGLIARRVGRAEKGRPLGRKFWDELPVTRVASND